MEKNELLAATLESGVDPLELRFIPVRNCSTGLLFAYRTRLLLNTQALGVLAPEDYSPVAMRTAQCVNLALSALTDICERIKDAPDAAAKAEWFSVACPVRMITKTDLPALLAGIFEENDFNDHKKICLEFPASVLFEDREKTAAVLKSLRLMGVNTAISGFGDDFCPAMRLSGFPFDYVILDSNVNSVLADDETSKNVVPLITFIRGLGMKIIADGVEDKALVSSFGTAGCSGYTGAEEPLTAEQTLPEKEV